MEKELISSFNNLKITWNDELNKSRVLDTIIYSYNRIVSKLGAAALNENALIGILGETILVPLKIYYAKISHVRKYSNVKSLVFGLLKAKYQIQSLSNAERNALNDVIVSSTKFFNGWNVKAIEEVVIVKNKQNVNDTRPLTGYMKEQDLFVGLSKDEVLALQAPLALEMLSQDPSKKDYLESQGFVFDDATKARYHDESSNEVNEVAMISDRYPVLAWFLMRSGYDGVTKMYSNASSAGVSQSHVDESVRSSLAKDIESKGAESVLQKALEKAANSK